MTPAYVNLGDLRLARGDPAGAIAMWETLTTTSPERAYLVRAAAGRARRRQHAGAVRGAVPGA